MRRDRLSGSTQRRLRRGHAVRRRRWRQGVGPRSSSTSQRAPESPPRHRRRRGRRCSRPGSRGPPAPSRRGRGRALGGNRRRRGASRRRSGRSHRPRPTMPGGSAAGSASGPPKELGGVDRLPAGMAIRHRAVLRVAVDRAAGRVDGELLVVRPDPVQMGVVVREDPAHQHLVGAQPDARHQVRGREAWPARPRRSGFRGCGRAPSGPPGSADSRRAARPW